MKNEATTIDGSATGTPRLRCVRSTHIGRRVCSFFPPFFFLIFFHRESFLLRRVTTRGAFVPPQKRCVLRADFPTDRSPPPFAMPDGEEANEIHRRRARRRDINFIYLRSVHRARAIPRIRRSSRSRARDYYVRNAPSRVSFYRHPAAFFPSRATGSHRGTSDKDYRDKDK